MNIYFKLSCKRIGLTGSLLFTLLLVACDNDDAKTIRERLVESDWQNIEVSIYGPPMPDVYTGVYNFSADGMYTRTFNDSILSGKWEMQGDSIVVFNKGDIEKRRFWRNIEISEDYLQVIFTNDISVTTNFEEYDINGSYISQKEVYIPVK